MRNAASALWPTSCGNVLEGMRAQMPVFYLCTVIGDEFGRAWVDIAKSGTRGGQVRNCCVCASARNR